MSCLLQSQKDKSAGTEQWLCVAGKASTPLHVEAEGASAMLRAAARALHFVLASEKGSKAVHGNEIVFMSAFQTAMSAFSDSLPDSMLLCACLGAIPSCDVITREVKVKGIDDAIFTTLEQVMQVSYVIQCCVTVTPCVHANPAERSHAGTLYGTHVWMLGKQMSQLHTDVSVTSFLTMSPSCLQVISKHPHVAGEHPNMELLCARQCYYVIAGTNTLG